jgi:hypothetical protein
VSERGGFPLALLILVAGFFIVMYLAFDVCVSDEGEKKDLGSWSVTSLR